MLVALNNQSQEDEHSCFSDNTHRDIILNAKSINNVYNGIYTRVNGTVISGKSIKDLITTVNATLAGSMNTLAYETITKTAAIPVPFDDALSQEAVGGTGPIMTAITSLQAQGDKIAEVAAALGITITTE
jgi:putative iron-regulated protein